MASLRTLNLTGIQRHSFPWIRIVQQYVGGYDLQVSMARRHLSVVSQYRTSTQMKPKYSFGLCGCGRIAGVHLKNLLSSQRVDLLWIIEDNEERVKEVKQQFYLGDSIPFYTSNEFSKLLVDNSLDAVVVNSPTNTHTDYICRALQNGKAVFSEKPAGESVGDIRTCYEAAEKQGRPFLTGYQRTGCNILSDVGVHDIDMVTWVTGAATPESILVTCHVNDPELHDCGQPDAMVALIKYPSGILYTMDVFRETNYGYDIRMEVFGSDGQATADNPRESSTITEGFHGGGRERLHYSFPQRFEVAFSRELDHFLDCLDGTAVPLITKEESVCVAEIIEKGVQSYKEHRLVEF